MTDDPDWGLPLQAEIGADRFPMVGEPALSARNAAAEILAAYLRRVEWYRATQPDVTASSGVTRFRLEAVLTNWPSAGQRLDYPSASIDDDAVPYAWHALTPTVLESTLGCFGRDTVLWKTAELELDFQVDFWTTSEPDREAIEAQLPRLFNPTEGRAGVLLSGHPRYFRRSLRASLLTHERMDTSDDAYTRERRLRASVRAEIEVVHLRQARELVVVPSFDFS